MTANLLILNSSKTEFLLIGRNNNSLKYTTHLSLQPTPLATLALSLANTLPSLDQIAALSKTWYYHVRELRCIRPYLTSKQPAPLPPLSSIINLTTAILCIITFQTVNLIGSSKFKTLLLALLIRLLNPYISLTCSNLSTGFKSRTDYKFLCLSHLQSSHNRSN